MDNSNVQRVRRLKNDPALNELFNNLVINKKKLTEEEFWKFDREDRARLLQDVSGGVSNQEFFIKPKQNMETGKVEFLLSAEDCKTLLQLYPDLNK